jgi:hypothetical protein
MSYMRRRSTRGKKEKGEKQKRRTEFWSYLASVRPSVQIPVLPKIKIKRGG